MLAVFFAVDEVKGCDCSMDFGCEITERVLVVGKVKKVYRQDGKELTQGDKMGGMFMSDQFAYLKILNTDDSVLTGKVIKVIARGGTSCSVSIYKGLCYFEWDKSIKSDSDTLTASIGDCTPKRYSQDKSTLTAYFSKRLEVKEGCEQKRKLAINDSLINSTWKNDFTNEFKPVFLLEAYQEMKDKIKAKWDSVSNEAVLAIPANQGCNRFRLYFTINILPSGDVFDVEVIKGEKAIEPYYDVILQQIEKTSFPKIKRDSGEGFEAYKLTVPLRVENIY